MKQGTHRKTHQPVTVLETKVKVLVRKAAEKALGRKAKAKISLATQLLPVSPLLPTPILPPGLLTPPALFARSSKTLALARMAINAGTSITLIRLVLDKLGQRRPMQSWARLNWHPPICMRSTVVSLIIHLHILPMFSTLSQYPLFHSHAQSPHPQLPVFTNAVQKLSCSHHLRGIIAKDTNHILRFTHAVATSIFNIPLRTKSWPITALFIRLYTQRCHCFYR